MAFVNPILRESGRDFDEEHVDWDPREWRRTNPTRVPFGRANVLSLSRHVPSRAGQADTRIYKARGAEAPGQRTARGRLL